MSEKAACPKCDSYVSEVWYDRRHGYCGWNCEVSYNLHAYGPHGHMEFTTDKRAVIENAKQRMAEAVGCAIENVSVDVRVDGYPAEPQSPWFDLDRDPPKPISDRKARENLREIRDRLVQNVDANLGL